MENQIQIQVLKQTELCGQQFQVYGTPQEPLFVAKDVACVIEHSDVSTMMRTVDEDEKLVQTIFVSGQNREVWMLTENGLYGLSRNLVGDIFIIVLFFFPLYYGREISLSVSRVSSSQRSPSVFFNS